MNPITDDYMREQLKTRKPYTFVILRNGPKGNEPNADKLIWEHGRRNFELRRDGELCIVCMITDESEVAGLCIFRTDLKQTRRIMEEDVAVRAGILTYEIHPVKSFPGDALPR
jgi:hypothetical protein